MLDFDFEPQRPAWARSLAVFDLETTGLDLRESRIVSAGVAVLDTNGKALELHEWLVNPGIEIPEQASNVHGITTEMAIDKGMSPEKAIAEILAVLAKHNKDMPLVAFNAPYDFTILHFEAKRYGLESLVPTPVIDPLVLDKKCMKYRKGKRTLIALCADYGVELTDAHNSTADAIAAGRLAQAQALKFPELDLTAGALHSLQVGWADEQAISFAEYLKTQNRPDFQAELGWPVRL
ncbi:3'-5' exonuclease [Candidatus Aquiluna sp. UB-MaderosW2red]|jgi:DNA polymerase-3 subunit epsilon|uniref:3'-5' exonuclease n=1 Tax=Candidatus Aquiluna sp. UB-MaderosW2red TaxID=1855377 RepID=UPI000875EE2B|nr:3'-5' exonuclease [Candidatus Aquiluna sp. UB-MaderosW2red]SCX12226.1 DNA polymerase-3 subunit epsilon [Candidatus Aquiluna sp. UB-MaderosW2red]